MKSKKNIWGNLIIAIFIVLIIAPLLTIVVWVFTERWAWPELIPQVFSTRALESVFRDSKELAQLFFLQHADFAYGCFFLGCDWNDDSKSIGVL